MVQYEYKAVNIMYYIDDEWVGEKIMDELGEAGWELVNVDSNIAYFKRPLVLEDDTPTND